MSQADQHAARRDRCQCRTSDRAAGRHQRGCPSRAPGGRRRPGRRRFHIVTAHPKEELRADSQYLGVSRQDVVYVRITLVRGRSRDTKLALYRAIADELAQEGVRHDDVAIVLTENSREDYSWGRGEAALLDLGPLPGVEDD